MLMAPTAPVTALRSRRTPLTGPRTLPVGIAPVPGEALESWLAILARHLDLQWGQFLRLIFPPGSLSGARQVAQINFTAHLSADELNAVSAATGIDAASIETLTWHRYNGVAGTVDGARRRMEMTWPFGRSRFCPVCLANISGRWQLEWRLPWVFACQKHSRLLADTCGACGRFQRTHRDRLRGHLVPAPERCSATTSTGERCEADLASTSTIALGEGHPFVMAQAFLSEIITGATVTFGLYQAMPATTAQLLDDLRLLAFRAAEATDAQSLAQIAPRRPSGDLLVEWSSADVRRWRASPAMPRAAPALIAAVGVSSALELLRCASLDEAAQRLGPYLAMRRATGKQVNIFTLTTRNRNPIPDAVMVRALTATMGPADQLRSRALAPLPRPAHKLAADALRGIPACLWADWAIRLLPPGRNNVRRRDATKVGLAILLANVGNRASDAQIAHHLGLGSLGSAWATRQSCQVTALLSRHRLWTNIAVALTRLADYLAIQPCPIDYARRRRLTYRKLLSENEWKQLFDATDFGSLDCVRTGQLVGTWLFRRISMLPAEMSPFPKNIADRTDSHSEPVELLAPPIAEQLDDIALRFLQRHKIVDEPLTWSPPLSLVADLQLPGPDVDLLNVEHLHPEILKGPRSLDSAAKALGVRPVVVCHLLERTPLPRPVCRGQHRPRKQTRLDRARLLLSRAELIRLYEHERWTFCAIATHFGIASKVVKQLALDYGIHVASPPTRSPRVVAVWLHQEYAVNQRPLNDIATDVGISRATARNLAKELGIQVRRGARFIAAEWIYQEHVVHGRLIKDLASEARLSPATLSKHAKELGIPVRRKTGFN
jgi:hypothetical protein